MITRISTALVAAALFAPALASAAPVNLSFTVTATDFQPSPGSPGSVPAPANFQGTFELTFDDAVGNILVNPGIIGTHNWPASGGLIYSYIGTGLLIGGLAGNGAGGFEPGFADFWLTILNANTNPTFSNVQLSDGIANVWISRTATLTVGADPNPVPEPGTVLLLSLGLGAIGLARQRRV